MTKEEQKEYNHKYYIENKSRRSEYYAKRRDKTNEYSRKYYAQKKQRLTDLEKENAELKADNDARKFSMSMSEKVEKQLQEQNSEMFNTIALQEQQIEKMKCCFNCKHSRTEYEHCRTDKHEKWEIKENDRM